MNGRAECSDEKLMRLLCQGEQEALVQLVERYQNDVLRFCLHYLGDMESAREIAQETFLRVYTARERFDDTRVFRPWMLCIARNMCLNILKRRKIIPMESLDALEMNEAGEVRPSAKASTGNPFEGIVSDERKNLLLNILNKLAPEVREVLVMRYFEQMSSREIAEVLETTEGAVRTRIHRALNQLRHACETRLDIR
ncbi:MAG: ECF RNA polymerase sigma factor SigW [Candidatus Hydrogenedentes bacterium ADurb.Bin101]|nr:MAG: ECF RNA polymerase sigma factor SigW [Candidatus Hydrogenedentes bacterium ADurb.Bin101]